MSVATRWRKSKAIKRAERCIDERLVDFGIELRVLRQDPAGTPVFPGTPPVRVLRCHRIGGLVHPRVRRVVANFRTNPNAYRAAGGEPRVWYCSEAQEPLLIREPGAAPKELVFGASGAGKTSVLAMVPIIWALDLVERGFTARRPLYAGLTAATGDRIGEVLKAFVELHRPEWYHHHRKAGVWELACGINIELRSTKEQSAATGSRIQGPNWAFHVGDEYQDQTYAHRHIVTRGRSAPDGEYRQLVTATSKDTLAWREFRDALPERLWRISRLEGPSNVFVPAQWWKDLKEELSDRAYRMHVLAEDVGPERALFPSWQRRENLRALPRLGAKDVTSEVLRTPNHTILIGHDPGTLRNVSVMLKAFRQNGAAHHEWFIVDELATAQTTTEEHAEELVGYLRDRWDVQWPDVDEPKALIRSDPWSKSDTTGAHEGVHRQLVAAGFKVLSADYSTQGRTVKPGRVSLPESVEMLNRLICAASGKRRLFVAANEDGKPMAPETMKAIEVSEWDVYGRKEDVRKDDKRKDPSDYTSAVRYALWAYERAARRRQFRKGIAL